MDEITEIMAKREDLAPLAGGVFADDTNGEVFKICSDLDNDCRDIDDKGACWMLHCERGLCLFMGSSTVTRHNGIRRLG